MKRGLALIAIALVALSAAVSAGAKSNDTTITGAGSTFVAPLVAAWTPALGHAFGYSVQYSAVGSGAGIAAITSNQVDFGASDAPLNQAQQSACPDCIQIPWALSAVSVFYNVPGAPVHVRLDGATISKIFLGQITNWNDPGDREAEPGRQLPGPEDHAGLPLGRLGHLVRVHRLPLGGQRELEEQDRRLDAAGLPGGRRRQGLIRRRGHRREHEGLDRLRRHRVRDQEPSALRSGQERGRQVPLPVAPADRGGGTRVPEGAGEQRAAHREPAEVGEARVPDQHLHLRDRPQEERARCRAAQDDLLGAHPGPAAAVRCQADVRARCRP